MIAQGDDYDFDLFLSYRRDPDLALAREVERFVEAFHTTPVDVDKVGELRPLAVCVDGSDFLLAPPGANPQSRSVDEVLARYLARSRELLVLCSRAAARPSFLDDEVRWFLEHRGRDWIRFAFTEGEEPALSFDDFLPPSLAGTGFEPLAYDLRGYDQRRAAGWRKVPPFEEELVRLACDLLGKPAGEVAPSFFRAELERLRSSSAQMASNAQFESLLGDPARALLGAVDAHDLHPSEDSERALRDASRAAILHHLNRRATTQITGSGPSFLAGRWKQGEVFARTSPDGRWRVLVTERGGDGDGPPGDVYLMSNESLRSIRLGSGGPRVEDVAFDSQSRHVFVTRQFYLRIFGLDGRLVGESTFQRWTKTPVPLVAGYALGRFVVGADAKGGLWMVDPDDYRGGVELRNEWSRDAVVAVDLAPGGELLAVVLESGAAELYALGGDDRPEPLRLAADGVLCARFADDATLLLAGEDRHVRRFEPESGSWTATVVSEALPAAVEWVAASTDTASLAAVGTDYRIFVLDAATGVLRHTLDHADAIDWKSLRSIGFAPERIHPRAAAGEAASHRCDWPPPTLDIVRAVEAAGEQLVFVRADGTAVSARHDCYRIDGGEAVRIARRVGGARACGEILFLTPEDDLGGRALWRDDAGTLRAVPDDETAVRAVCAYADAVWIATAKGALTFRDGRFERMTPDSWDLRDAVVLDDRLWLRSGQGVLASDGTNVVRMTESFVDVERISEAGGSVWLLRPPSWIEKHSGGPAIRIDGWTTRELPGRSAKVADVLDAGRAAWLIEEDRVHRVEGDELLTVAGLKTYGETVVEVGATAWLTTRGRAIMKSAGPTYRIDLETLSATALSWSDAQLFRTSWGAFASFIDSGVRVCARLGADGPDVVDIGDGLLRAVSIIDDELWLATTAGACKVDAAGATRVGPRSAVMTIQGVGTERWLLGSDAVVRVDEEGERRFDTQPVSAARVVAVGTERWLLTRSDGEGETGDWYWQVTARPGPALRVDGETASRHGDAVTDVMSVGGETWLRDAPADGDVRLIRP